MRKYTLFVFTFLGISIFFDLPQGLCRLNISDGGGEGGGNGGPMVKVEGRQLKVDFDSDGNYETYTVKGAGYSPYPIGRHVSDWGSNIFDDPNILTRDFALLQSMHANTIRIWKGNDTQDGTRFQTKLTTQTLNLADQYGLKVIAGFWVDAPGPACGVTYYPLSFLDPSNPNYTNDRNTIINNFGQYVSNFKTHQAILFWAIGNENNLYIPSQYWPNWYSLVNLMAQKAHDTEESTYHPVAVINGDIGNIGQAQYGTTDALLPYVDIWGSNVYRGSSFGTLFAEFSAATSKPLWISEYGIDSYFTIT